MRNTFFYSLTGKVRNLFFPKESEIEEYSDHHAQDTGIFELKEQLKQDTNSLKKDNEDLRRTLTSVMASLL